MIATRSPGPRPRASSEPATRKRTRRNLRVRLDGFSLCAPDKPVAVELRAAAASASGSVLALGIRRVPRVDEST